MDCLRSVKTGRHHLGGLGYDKCSNSGCIRRGTGRNVKHNREIVPKKLDGYITIGCMQKAMRYSNFAQVRLYTVPLDEQKEIAEYLDKKCSEIDELIAKKTAFLSELESYKKSLIYEYVTGKKEV